MDTANVFVAIGGDRGYSVPKHVTVPELRLLQAIHGAEAVFDITPTDPVERTTVEELARLREHYGIAKDNDGNPILLSVYPGARPEMPLEFDDLGLDESLFAAKERVKPTKAAAPAKKGRKAAEDAAEPAGDILD